MQDKKKNVCLWLSVEEHEELKRIAEREHRSVSNLIEVWIAEHKKG